MSGRSAKGLLTAAALFIGLAAAPLPAGADAPDPWITTKVKMELVLSSELSALDVNVDTIDGRVTLHGSVDSDAEKRAAETLARQIQGVSDVRNLLQVVPATQQAQTEVSDEQLATHVRERLAGDSDLADSAIEVKSVENGVVLLEGRATTLSDHLRALEQVRSLDGVTGVASQIQSPNELADAEIWRAEALEAEGKGTAASPSIGDTARDLWITTKAKIRLIGNAGVPALEVNVDTRNADVTLFGIVPTDASKAAAEAEVEQVAGVKSVRNELQVVPESRREIVEVQDERAAAMVRERLASRDNLRGADLDVEVSDGVARLTGSVASQGDRLTALVVARGTDGIRSAVDDLQVAKTVPDVAAGADTGDPQSD